MHKIIDAHSHFMPPDVAKNTAFFKAGWSDVERQLAVMDENGVEQSLLLYPTSDAHLNMGGWLPLSRVYNEGVADIVRKYPGRFVGAGVLPVDQPELFDFSLRNFKLLGLRAISLASSYEGKYLDDEMFTPVYEFAQEAKLPVHVHPQIINPIGEERVKDPLLTPVLEYVFDVSVCIGKMMMNGTFSKFPDVKFIFAHFGGVLPIVKERFDNTYQMLRKRNFINDLTQLPGEYFKNLFFDTSGSRSSASLMCALEMADASHILFGSDYPANQNYAASIKISDDKMLSDEERAAVLFGNFHKLFAGTAQNLSPR